MELKLVFPLEEHELLWMDIVKEIEDTKEKMIPYALSFGQMDFKVFLNRTQEAHEGINIGSLVPATTYFLMEEGKQKILGAINIRHYLNDELLFRGGHIGYGIRPTERRKGYAARMLELGLIKCKELGLDKVLVTCDQGNEGSARTIIKNGGVMENEVTEASGNIVQRYWIDISLMYTTG